MFPSSNNDNPSDFLLKRPWFLIDQNPSTFKQDDPPFFLNFSSPFFDEHELPLNQILSHDHQTQIMSVSTNDRRCYGIDDQESFITRKEVTKPTNIIVASKSDDQKKDDDHDHQLVNPNGSTNTTVAPAARRRNLGVIPRKRTGKKDRHSKICTAQGIRDRRMRLSLQVARKFFDLQDMLGFDKASKTIEWLFTKSKKAIKELTKDHPYISASDAKSESFLSECEVVSSGIEEISNNNGIKEGIEVPTKPCDAKSKKTCCNNTSNIRESRDKARARARCRTREKMMSKWFKSNPNNQENDHDVLKLGFSNSSPFEGVDQESTPRDHQERVSQYISHFNSIGEISSSDIGTIEKLLGNSRTPPTSCPCPVLSHDNYNNCPDSVPGNCIDSNTHFMGFLGNWDLLNNDRSMTSDQFAMMTNQDSLAGNPNSTYSAATQNFPLFHQ